MLAGCWHSSFFRSQQGFERHISWHEQHASVQLIGRRLKFPPAPSFAVRSPPLYIGRPFDVPPLPLSLVVSRHSPREARPQHSALHSHSTLFHSLPLAFTNLILTPLHGFTSLAIARHGALEPDGWNQHPDRRRWHEQRPGDPAWRRVLGYECDFSEGKEW